MRRHPAQAMGEATPTPGRKRVPPVHGFSQFVPVLTSFRRRARPSQRPAELTVGNRARVSRRGRPRAHWVLRSILSPSERSPGLLLLRALLRPEVPGFGAVCLARSARVLDRRTGVAVDFRWDSRADRLRRTRAVAVGACSRRTSGSPRLLLFSKPILRGGSSQSVPIHSPSSSRPWLANGEPSERRLPRRGRKGGPHGNSVGTDREPIGGMPRRERGVGLQKR